MAAYRVTIAEGSPMACGCPPGHHAATLDDVLRCAAGRECAICVPGQCPGPGRCGGSLLEEA